MSSELKMPKKAKKVKKGPTNQPTYQPTNQLTTQPTDRLSKQGVEWRSTRLLHSFSINAKSKLHACTQKVMF